MGTHSARTSNRSLVSNDPDATMDHDDQELPIAEAEVRTNVSLVSNIACHSQQPRLKPPKQRPPASSTPRRSVSFPRKPAVSQSTILSIDDYTDEEFDACWYKKEELKAIEKYNKKLAKRMTEKKNNKTEIGGDDSFRGLEHMTEKGQELEDELYFLSQEVVLEAYFDEDEEVDMDELATVYSKVTRKCKLLALAAGLQDEQKAQLIFQQMEEKKIETTNKGLHKKDKKKPKKKASSKEATKDTKPSNRRKKTKKISTSSSSGKAIQGKDKGAHSSRRKGTSSKPSGRKRSISKKAPPIPSADKLEAPSISVTTPAA